VTEPDLGCGVMMMTTIPSSIGAGATEFKGARRLEMSIALGRLQKQSTATRIAVFLRLLASTASLDLGKDGSPLGLFSDTGYLSGRVCLQEGAVLALYADGILDAANTEQDQFGEERLRETLRASLSLSASKTCQRVVGQMDEFSAGSPQWDDVTLAVVKVKSEVADLSTVGMEERNEVGD
jgi:hypothetical protein